MSCLYPTAADRIAKESMVARKRLTISRIVALALTLLVHMALFVVLLRPFSPARESGLWLRGAIGVEERAVISARLIVAAHERRPTTAQSARPATANNHRPLTPPGRTKTTVDQPMGVSTHGAESIQKGRETGVSTPRISSFYNADGSINLPASPLPVQAGIDRANELSARGHNLLHCRHTSFSSAYTPYESAGEALARHLAVIGLYNPETAKKVQRRSEDAARACDE